MTDRPLQLVSTKLPGQLLARLVQLQRHVHLCPINLRRHLPLARQRLICRSLRDARHRARTDRQTRNHHQCNPHSHAGLLSEKRCLALKTGPSTCTSPQPIESRLCKLRSNPKSSNMKILRKKGGGGVPSLLTPLTP